MSVLTTAIDPRSAAYLEHRSLMLERLEELARLVSSAPDRRPTRPAPHAPQPQQALPQQQVRDLVELLVDRDTPLLELAPTAALGTGHPVGAGVTTAIGVVAGRLCLIVTSGPTPGNPYAERKLRRAAEIARANALPVVNLVACPPGPGPTQALHQPGGADPRGQLPGGPGVPGSGTVTVLLGAMTVATARLLGTGGHVVLLRGYAGDGHPSGLVATDEVDAVRLARMVVARCHAGPVAGPELPVDAPRYHPADLLAVAPAAGGPQADPREILARLLDGSRFEEFEPAEASGLVTGWGVLHGYRTAVLADRCRLPGPADCGKAARFVRLATEGGLPMVLLWSGGRPHTVGPATSAQALVDTVAQAPVPKLAVHLGQAPAAGDLARFRFSWPTAPGYRDTAPGYRTGQADDDGTIDPRDTRTVLGLCLAVVRGRPAAGGRHWRPSGDGRER